MLPIQRKGKFNAVTIIPFPLDHVAVGYFTGLDIEIFDQNSIKTIHESGCYGLNPKPRQLLQQNLRRPNKSITQAEYNRRLDWKGKFSDPEEKSVQESVLVDGHLLPNPYVIPDSLILFLEEAFFLLTNIRCLEIRDLDDSTIPADELWKTFCNIKDKFIECYVAYLYLKSKNWVIKSGAKFGGDFLLYKQSPHLYHASFIVIVKTANSNTRELHTGERIAETTNKNLLFLEIYFPDDVEHSEYFTNLHKFIAKEAIVQRHGINQQK